MPTTIFVNLPVKNLPASREFFGALGYSFNENFSDENAASMVISDTIFAMLLTEEYFKTFIPTEVADASKVTEALFAITVDSREAVDEMVTKAIAAGGSEPRPAQDMGFMYNRAFRDLDHHIWEITWMDPQAAEGVPPAE